jgi:hypothetical protein
MMPVCQESSAVPPLTSAPLSAVHECHAVRMTPWPACTDRPMEEHLLLLDCQGRRYRTHAFQAPSPTGRFPEAATNARFDCWSSVLTAPRRYSLKPSSVFPSSRQQETSLCDSAPLISACREKRCASRRPFTFVPVPLNSWSPPKS